ncbi:hypothetical protein HDU76_007556 [Blyttiomyces sp. JEL0837]|nr:hypothetical protein HDU76_007556 [Blyttiomyces sp. JEL0837]
MAAIAGTACQTNTYTGAVCPANVMTYQTAVPPANYATIDTLLKTQLAALEQIKGTPCAEALVALACTSVYPACVNGVTQTPCLASCQEVYATCAPTFGPIGRMNDLTLALGGNCTIIPTAPTAEPWGKDGSCYKSAVIDKDVAAFFKKSKIANAVATQNNCASNNCCVPCPVQDYFYPVGSFEASVLYVEIGNGISALLAGYVVLSWAVLPGRRQHPGDIVLHFSIAVMIWQACAFFLYGNPKRVQCADETTIATASNNTLCGAQGALVMCAVHAAVMWAGYMICNLHATIVWRSSVFERYKPLGVILCWGLPGIFTFIPFLLSSVDGLTGVTCIISPDKANYYFFSVQALVVIPSFFLNIATMIHIMIVARRSGSSNMSQSRSGNGYSSQNQSGNGYSGGNSVKPLSARRQMLQLLKLNWRALFLGLVFITTYVVYVTFFNLVVAKIATTNSNTPWVQAWTQCIVTKSTNMTINDAQNACAGDFSSNLPSFAMIVTSNVIVSTVGLWIFFIFGFNLQILYDWGAWFEDMFSGRRGKMDDTEWR